MDEDISVDPFAGDDVNYRAWIVKTTEECKNIDDKPKKVIAMHSWDGSVGLGPVYTNRICASEFSIGFNQSELKDPIYSDGYHLWCLVFRRGEEPIPEQVVNTESIASFN